MLSVSIYIIGIMTSLVFDIETDDLDATKIWCISICDVDTEEVSSYYGDTLIEGVKKLEKADKLIGHNIFQCLSRQHLQEN